MTRLRYIIVSFVFAIILTWLGWWFALGRKEPPQIPLALWFPVIPLLGVSGINMILPSLIQFPMMALLFVTGIRRWSAKVVFAALAFGYALAAGTAVIIVTNR